MFLLTALFVTGIIAMIAFCLMYSIAYTRRSKRQKDEAKMKKHLSYGKKHYYKVTTWCSPCE